MVEACQAGGGSTPHHPAFLMAPMHANATLTPLRRARMIAELASSGASLRAVAARYGVCEKTVRRWRDRAQALGSPARLPDGSSGSQAPTHPHQRSRGGAHRGVAPAAAHLRADPPGAAWRLHGDPLALLRRHGLARLSALEPPRPPPVRYEYPAAGGLLHLDIKKLGKFTQPGVRATGERRHRNPGAGVESLHVAIDDHSRVAFACLHPDEKQPRVVDALRQAVVFYAARGVFIERVLIDRGASYRSKLFAQACRELGLRPPLYAALPTPDQRQGRALHPDTHPRVGLRARAYDSSAERAALSATRRSIVTSGMTALTAAACTCTCAEHASSSANATATTTAGGVWRANGTSASGQRRWKRGGSLVTGRSTPSWAARKLAS